MYQAHRQLPKQGSEWDNPSLDWIRSSRSPLKSSTFVWDFQLEKNPVKLQVEAREYAIGQDSEIPE